MNKVSLFYAKENVFYSSFISQNLRSPASELTPAVTAAIDFTHVSRHCTVKSRS